MLALANEYWRRFAYWLWQQLCERVVFKRLPDQTIGGWESPYMHRWWLTPWSGMYRDIRSEDRTVWQQLVTQLPNVYLHCFCRSDDDRALHDHPWANASFLLKGCYLEHTIAAGGIHRRVLRESGDVAFRWAKTAHRIEIVDGRCWSLFVTGFRVRVWGFHCPEKGWVDWRDFTNEDDGGATIGRGCN